MPEVAKSSWSQIIPMMYSSSWSPDVCTGRGMYVAIHATARLVKWGSGIIFCRSARRAHFSPHRGDDLRVWHCYLSGIAGILQAFPDTTEP